jgi:hypothetical protein
MSADTLVFDMSSQSEGSPSVFVRKDWLSILDNQNQNYQGNQSVIDTSQLANSNKYMNYREAYLTVPMVMTLTGGTTTTTAFAPNTTATSADFSLGLKNWYGSIVHSFTLDYNGTTIIQQTPYIGLWNTFKLMNTLCYDDLLSSASQLGFYPDSGLAWSYTNAASLGGVGTVNNVNGFSPVITAGQFNQSERMNNGLLQRQLAWNLNPSGLTGTEAGGQTYASVMTATNMGLLFKSYIYNTVDQVSFTPTASTGQGCFQVCINATIYLKHLASFFERVPLLKGVFMKLTLNLNQSSVTLTTSTAGYASVAVNSPLGGVSPIMIASALPGIAGTTTVTGIAPSGGTCFPPFAGTYVVSLAVGRTVLNSVQTSLSPAVVAVNNSPLPGSILLNVPAYTFNPVFEGSYLSSAIKKVVYTDVYQYQILNISAGQNFNNLISNGIANIKSVLVMPIYSSSAIGTTSGAGIGAGISPLQSPFDPCGGGPTSPMCLFSQFNIQISGQNAIYNTERYSYEQYLNQLHGQLSVNGGMTDGMTSGLVDQKLFENSYCYYYVNCGRMLPVEEAVPKSVSVMGVSLVTKNVDLFVFVEYGVEVSIDILTGARV